MSIREIISDGSRLLLIALTIIQIAPVKINPWSSLARLIRIAIYGDVSKRLDAIAAVLDSHIDMDDRRTADGHRARVLHFNNELLRSIDHTKEEFIEVLTEIDAYERYCEEQPHRCWKPAWFSSNKCVQFYAIIPLDLLPSCKKSCFCRRSL